MHDEIAIKVEHLSKVYKMFSKPVDRVKEAINPLHKRYSRDFYALTDVSFEIKKGDTVGFIGKNGAGKSTILKILTGVLTPTDGAVIVNGRVASLLELGAGFNPEMTGIENIYMNGTIMGYSHDSMEARIDDIVSFADIGDFIQQPVKTYSSGMFARLAFAVNAFVEPDILIVDEALSVGDSFFQAKCMDKMKQLMESGVTILFVSHDWGAVKNICKKGILLEQGKIIKSGNAGEVVEAYRKMQLEARRGGAAAIVPKKEENNAIKDKRIQRNDSFLKNAAYQRMQNGKLEFCNVQLLNENENIITETEYGQKVILRMVFKANVDVDCVALGYHLRDKAGIDVVYADSQLDNRMIHDVKAGDQYIVDWKFQMNLREGLYNFACVMSIPIDLPLARKVECCDFIPCALQFNVIRNIMELGAYVHWHNDVNVEKI